jgi:branched-chain amino acid transport system substrate-binding protein
VLFREASTYTQLLHDYFEARFKELGGKVLAVESYRLDASDISAKVAKLPATDLIYLAGLPDGVTLVVPALRNAGIETPILGGDGLDIGEAWKRIDTPSNVYFATHAYIGADNPAPAVKEFRAAFTRAYPGNEPDALPHSATTRPGCLWRQSKARTARSRKPCAKPSPAPRILPA